MHVKKLGLTFSPFVNHLFCDVKSYWKVDSTMKKSMTKLNSYKPVHSHIRTAFWSLENIHFYKKGVLLSDLGKGKFHQIKSNYTTKHHFTCTFIMEICPPRESYSIFYKKVNTMMIEIGKAVSNNSSSIHFPKKWLELDISELGVCRQISTYCIACQCLK